MTFALASRLGLLLSERQVKCAVAESCTGGGLAAAITDIAGSSCWFDRGFVTYSNEAKQEMLGVPLSVITTEGAVSQAVVCAMARGVIMHSHAAVGVAISGIAGPTGGSREKPVGTVWIAFSDASHKTQAQKYVFEGDRGAIRQQAIHAGLEGLIRLLAASDL